MPPFPLHALLALLAGLLTAAALPGQTVDLQGSTPRVLYDHSLCPLEGSGTCHVSAVLDLADGEPFNVVIENTDSTKFNYLLLGAVELVQPPVRGAAPAEVEHSPVVLSRTHDDRYGGYVVLVSKKPNETPERSDVMLLIHVRDRGWNVGLGAGFTVSDLTDAVYAAAQEGAADAPVFRIQRDEEAEDELQLGLVSLVHLWHTRLPWLAGSFGLGLEDNRPSYHFGPSFRFGDVAAITTGLIIGSVDALPAGVAEDQFVSDPNVLSDLRARTDTSWFFGLSYTFLDGAKDVLARPFAGPE